MIATAAAWLVARGVPLRFARPLMLVAVVLLAGLAWRCSVDEREAGQRAVNVEQARKADQGAAEQQRVDDGRNRAEREQLEKVPTDANPISDRERAYLRCVRLQQRARANGEPTPAC